MPTSKNKIRILSGIQPTGALHIGNYLGALKNFVTLQADHESYFMVADLHSLTEPYEAEEKPQQILNLTASYLSAGLDPKKSIIFLQSLVPEHAELAWIFNTIIPVSELERMTQYKDKAEKQITNINVGLLTYPVLQAADILLYKPQLIPIGEDQQQHLELTRTVARKFNKRFGVTFLPPKPLHTSVPRLMSLTDPTRKMSKSEPSGCLFLEDSPEIIERKIKRAVTDTSLTSKEMSPGVKTLFLLLREFGNAPMIKKFNEQYDHGTISYKELKEILAQDIIKALKPFQARYQKLIKKPNYLREVLATGSKRARQVATITLKEVKKKMGLSII